MNLPLTSDLTSDLTSVRIHADNPEHAITTFHLFLCSIFEVFHSLECPAIVKYCRIAHAKLAS